MSYSVKSWKNTTMIIRVHVKDGLRMSDGGVKQRNDKFPVKAPTDVYIPEYNTLLVVDMPFYESVQARGPPAANNVFVYLRTTGPDVRTRRFRVSEPYV